MNGQVVKYLTKYAALRKLNTKWAAYHLCKDTLSQPSCDGTSQEDEDRMETGGGLRGAELRRGRSIISVTSRTSRFSRHPSLRVPTRALPSLVLDKPPASVKAVCPPPCTLLFEVFVYSGLPSQLTRSSIERCKQSRIHHWLLLQYVAVFPPAVFLQGQRIEVDSKAKAREVSDRLFWALAKDASELAATEQQAFRDSPPNIKPRATTPFFSDFPQSNKQQQHNEQERTVTWLGSPELQKVVTIDPTEEVCRTAVAAAATATATATTSAAATTATTAPAATPNSGEASATLPNNSTASTDPAGEGDCNTRLNSSCPPSVSLQASLQGDCSSEGEGLCPRSEASSCGSASASEAASVGSTRKGRNRRSGKRIAEILGASAAPAPAAAATASSTSHLIREGRQRPAPEATETTETAQGDAEADRRAEGSDSRAAFGEASKRPRAPADSEQPAQMHQDTDAYTPASVDACARERGGGVGKRDEEGVEVAGASLISQPPPRIATSSANGATPVEDSVGVKELWRTSCPSAPPYQGSVSLESGPSCTYSSSNEDMAKEARRTKEPKPGKGDLETDELPDNRQKMTSEVLGAANTTNSSFFDDYASSCFFSRTSPSASDCHLAAASTTSGERNGPQGSSRRLLDPSSAGEEDYFPARRRRRAFKRNMPEYFTRSFVEMFLKEDEVEEFMKLVDLAGHGKINQPMFKRAVVSIYKMRKALLKSLTSQASICKTVRRMISVVLWVATLVAMLLVFGVNLNTVLVSGAASISALVVALSYIYQNFITAVIFVAFTNPYNVGDRVRIDNGEAMYVRNIHTYTTEFVTIHSKPIVYSNSVLFGRQLTNESRATNATFSMPMRLDIRTQLQSLRFLEAGMRRAIAARPMDFVKDSFSIYITDVQPGRWMDITVWLSAVEGWGNAPKVLRLRTDMYLVLQRLCLRFGISYQEPLLPVQLNASTPTTTPAAAAAISSPQTQQTGAPLHQFHSSASHGAAAEDAYGAWVNSGSWEQVKDHYRGSPTSYCGVPLHDLKCEPSEFSELEALEQVPAAYRGVSGGQLKRRRPNSAQYPSPIRCSKTSTESCICHCCRKEEKDETCGMFERTSRYRHVQERGSRVLPSASSRASARYIPHSFCKANGTETETETERERGLPSANEPLQRQVLNFQESVCAVKNVKVAGFVQLMQAWAWLGGAAHGRVRAAFTNAVCVKAIGF
ncbi:hypothetical protein, conserved [Eimeria praecox]|uniref:EF-hand domain-containing protein n=1 Tax=Eimeria praecox TaxID=51316 RepID=U6H2D0_9EIME|nr:hypothetical protein, conserved [Eimeria praecox]